MPSFPGAARLRRFRRGAVRRAADADAGAPSALDGRRPGWPLPLLAWLLLLVIVCALCIGAYPIPLRTLLAIALGQDHGDMMARAVAWDIRLPRVLAGVVAGATLGASGCTMQALFRNPLADPGLIGVSSGAALGASAAIVLLPTSGALAWQGAVLPAAAFGGAMGVVVLVYRLGAAGGALVVQWLLLAGIAVNAMAGAAIGLLGYVATDAQLRSLTFWSLGSLASGSWTMLGAMTVPAVLGCALLMRHRHALTVFQLGEAEAEAIGIDVRRVKRDALLATALCVGGVVCQTGVIGFIGLVAPHCLRLICGPDLRRVLPGAMLLGALLVVSADLLARTIAAPADVPIGILTALIGAPFFMGLLLRRKSRAGL
ncbi:iron ABC transporter permease [Robbsia sp. KACC 23696]|uniref:FecCD family ABC transporter permease n=1 Tax=Robbsia sp. KACC 23696 TaxID=3149231 RepID=UPI00325BA76F